MVIVNISYCFLFNIGEEKIASRKVVGNIKRQSKNTCDYSGVLRAGNIGHVSAVGGVCRQAAGSGRIQ
jgi:hypothetical protein